MHWNANDMDTYLQQQEYIDTLLIPLVRLETDPAKMKSSASATEFLMNLSSFIETQFKGRMMMTPPFSYTQSTDLADMAATLSKDVASMPFEHVFYVTTDNGWTSIDMEGEVIWLPAIPLESMDKSLKQSVIEDQLKQVLPILTKKWSNG